MHLTKPATYMDAADLAEARLPITSSGCPQRVNQTDQIIVTELIHERQ